MDFFLVTNAEEAWETDYNYTTTHANTTLLVKVSLEVEEGWVMGGKTVGAGVEDRVEQTCSAHR